MGVERATDSKAPLTAGACIEESGQCNAVTTQDYHSHNECERFIATFSFPRIESGFIDEQSGEFDDIFTRRRKRFDGRKQMKGRQ